MRIILFIYLFILSAAASAQRRDEWKPNKQVQCRLVNWKYEGINKAELVVVTANNDTMILKYGWGGIGRKVFERNQRLMVEYDTSSAAGCPPGTYIKSRIRFNH